MSHYIITLWIISYSVHNFFCIGSFRLLVFCVVSLRLYTWIRENAAAWLTMWFVFALKCACTSCTFTLSSGTSPKVLFSCLYGRDFIRLSHTKHPQSDDPDHALFIPLWTTDLSAWSFASFRSPCATPHPFYLPGQKLHYWQGKPHWPNLTGSLNSLSRLLRLFHLFCIGLTLPK